MCIRDRLWGLHSRKIFTSLAFFSKSSKSMCHVPFSHTGDKVMIQTPVYSEFYDVTEAWEREVVENKLVEENGTCLLYTSRCV